MIKLRIISFFLSLLLTLQMLPIAQIGSMLSQNQWTEELPHDADESGKAEPSVKYIQPYLPPSAYITSISSTETKCRAYIHHCKQMPSNHSTEVVTPPPDSVS